MKRCPFQTQLNKNFLGYAKTQIFIPDITYDRETKSIVFFTARNEIMWTINEVLSTHYSRQTVTAVINTVLDSLYKELYSAKTYNRLEYLLNVEKPETFEAFLPIMSEYYDICRYELYSKLGRTGLKKRKQLVLNHIYKNILTVIPDYPLARDVPL